MPKSRSLVNSLMTWRSRLPFQVNFLKYSIPFPVLISHSREIILSLLKYETAACVKKVNKFHVYFDCESNCSWECIGSYVVNLGVFWYMWNMTSRFHCSNVDSTKKEVVTHHFYKITFMRFKAYSTFWHVIENTCIL